MGKKIENLFEQIKSAEGGSLFLKTCSDAFRTKYILGREQFD
jgi:hypothetical protein